MLLSLQRTAGNAGVSGLVNPEECDQSSVKDVIGSGRGSPLDETTRHVMETRLGHDFGDVRVHTDAQASKSARAINAHAYTSGTDVVFQTDKYAPDTESGQRTLAHELTHVVQQKAGPVAGSPAPGGISLSDPGDAFEREADRVAEQVVSHRATAMSAPDNAGTTGIQRQAAEEEESVQGTFVQRQEGEEEEAEA